jgi:hypothetical protein
VRACTSRKVPARHAPPALRTDAFGSVLARALSGRRGAVAGGARPAPAARWNGPLMRLPALAKLGGAPPRRDSRWARRHYGGLSVPAPGRAGSFHSSRWSPCVSGLAWQMPSHTKTFCRADRCSNAKPTT